MPVSEDTEITLGTGKLLAVFFGLVLVCAIFFGMGFSLGRAENKPSTTSEQPVDTGVVATSKAPSGAGNSANPADLSFYKAVQSKDRDTELATGDSDPADKSTSSPSKAASAAKSDRPKSPPLKPSSEEAPAAPRGSAYYVQVAAVSKQEDADALVQALKQKQYPAFAATSPADKFFHVQLGPFSDVREAESTRTKLMAAGYSPILKK